jgi:hypothetical protein
MEKGKWGWLVLLAGLTAGCCSQPGIFQKVNRSMESVQSYYAPLIQDDLNRNDKLRLAVVAADTTLLLAGELQSQWCPDPRKAEHLELQAQEARKMAQEAGVAAAGTSPAGNSEKSEK